MLNQALLEGMLIQDGDLVAAASMPWVRALERFARQSRQPRRARTKPLGACKALLSEERPETTMTPRSGATV